MVTGMLILNRHGTARCFVSLSSSPGSLTQSVSCAAVLLALTPCILQAVEALTCVSAGFVAHVDVHCRFSYLPGVVATWPITAK